MGFRFWRRRVRIAPGVTLNLSKSGASLSFGPRGAKLTIGPRGGRATVGIPGTGLFYTKTLPKSQVKAGTKRSGRKTEELLYPPVPKVRPEDRLTLSFFQRLVTPHDEKAFVDGCRALFQGDEERAFKFLQKSVHLADGAYLAGFLALNRLQLKKAADYLNRAAEQHRRLGRYFAKYGLDIIMGLPITDELCAHVGPNLRGVLLGLVEIYQRQRRWRDAISCLERLLNLEPEDPVVLLSLIELLWEVQGDNKQICRRIVRLTADLENNTPVHTALFLYKARALRKLGLLEAARETLTIALRRKKERPEELLRAIRYERALVYEALGQARRARRELEKLYAEAPDYADVAARLGL